MCWKTEYSSISTPKGARMFLLRKDWPNRQLFQSSSEMMHDPKNGAVACGIHVSNSHTKSG